MLSILVINKMTLPSSFTTADADSATWDDKLVANKLLTELEKVEPWNFSNYTAMLSAVILMRNSAAQFDSLPELVRNDLIYKIYSLNKTIQQITHSLVSDFRDITRKAIETHLEVLEQKEHEEKVRLQEEREQRIKNLTEGTDNIHNDDKTNKTDRTKRL